VKEGGNNTKYFHLMTSGKHRNKRIFQLEQGEGTIVGEQNLKVYITEHYKKLFRVPAKNHFSMCGDNINDIPWLSPEENSILIADFTKKEVHEATSRMEHNMAPGQTGSCGVTKLLGRLLTMT
jgi:hypothetical protein